MDLETVKKHWNDPKTVSLRDGNLQELERLYIIDALQGMGGVGSLVDIGCGDGVDTEYWCNYAQKVFACDYSEAMLAKARERLQAKAELFRFDILNDELDRKYDVAISKRCLINLGDLQNQEKAIIKIFKAIEKGGYFIMLECCTQGLDNLNRMRTKVGLKPIEMPFHNIYLDMETLQGFLKRYFSVESIRYFSTYYFLTRVYSQTLDKDDFSRFDETAKNMQKDLDVLSAQVIGPQFLMVLKKRSEDV